ncbi:hypothetical protein PFLUV_G00265790 [Perca fluviatilis]|uniref:Uncharacterized protein n=1 Tax=Perca fluviatilis TaxID=8168 RepID=A0A6A5E8Y2_PERFL|nr:hypothetical protein PFLUV_G00265790 [Perca fluviatilis]
MCSPSVQCRTLFNTEGHNFSLEFGPLKYNLGPDAGPRAQRCREFAKTKKDSKRALRWMVYISEPALLVTTPPEGT